MANANALGRPTRFLAGPGRRSRMEPLGGRLLAGEESEQAVGGAVGKHDPVVAVGFGGELRAAREEGVFVFPERERSK